ncbi:MAG: hypothetical protein H0U45_14490 [Tatlockia sp.]|jgi:hypothetical protein|nr:hypothetical protein [Tatlockia sp.]
MVRYFFASIFIITILFSQCSNIVWKPATNNESPSSRFLTDEKNESKDIILIPDQAIKAEAEKVGLIPLKDATLLENETEIRIIVGFGLAKSRWFVLNKKNNYRTSFIIFTYNRKGKFFYGKIELNTPTSGWKSFEDFLSASGLTLPLRLKSDTKNLGTRDGEAIILEIKTGSYYEKATFHNPPFRVEGEKVIDICFNIKKQFGISLSCELNRSGYENLNKN